MITADLAKKKELRPQESYKKMEQVKRENAFLTFKAKMSAAEKSLQMEGYYSEEEVEEELSKI